MKVKDCKNCKHCERRTFSTYHIPKNYHPVGFSHAYAYCTLHQKRVSEVKKCKEIDNVTTDKHFCGNCMRFTQIDDCSGECHIYGYTSGFTLSDCKHFIDVKSDFYSNKNEV